MEIKERGMEGHGDKGETGTTIRGGIETLSGCRVVGGEQIELREPHHLVSLFLFFVSFPF